MYIYVSKRKKSKQITIAKINNDANKNGFNFWILLFSFTKGIQQQYNILCLSLFIKIFNWNYI